MLIYGLIFHESIWKNEFFLRNNGVNIKRQKTNIEIIKKMGCFIKYIIIFSSKINISYSCRPIKLKAIQEGNTPKIVFNK